MDDRKYWIRREEVRRTVAECERRTQLHRRAGERKKTSCDRMLEAINRSYAEGLLWRDISFSAVAALGLSNGEAMLIQKRLAKRLSVYLKKNGRKRSPRIRGINAPH